MGCRRGEARRALPDPVCWLTTSPRHPSCSAERRRSACLPRPSKGALKNSLRRQGVWEGECFCLLDEMRGLSRGPADGPLKALCEVPQALGQRAYGGISTMRAQFFRGTSRIGFACECADGLRSWVNMDKSEKRFIVLGSQQCVTTGRDEACVCHVAFRSLLQTNRLGDVSIGLSDYLVWGTGTNNSSGRNGEPTPVAQAISRSGSG